MPDSKNLYALLAVDKSATEKEVSKAYRQLARKYHPDVNPGDKQAEEHFKEIAAAYEVLIDTDRRKLYDEFGHEGLKDGFDPGQARAYQQWQSRTETSGAAERDDDYHFDLNDLKDFFGQDFSSQPRGPRSGHNLHAHVELDFLQALQGVQLSLTAPDGSGDVTVRIPPGASDGSVLKVKGRGLPGADWAPRGDLVITTRVRPHAHFKRDGLDLILTLPITISEAYNGASVEVPTIDGPVVLKVPPRSQNGSRLRLKKKGVARKDQKGDLYVELALVTPDIDNKEFSEALQASAELYSKPVRQGIEL